MRVVGDPGTRELSVRIGSLESIGQLLHDIGELTEVDATAQRETIRDKFDKLAGVNKKQKSLQLTGPSFFVS